ncbi:MAG: hypothetical protein KJN71_07495 [Acidimicrobiia bacterium]|nr:hypothetical protein [Acidimicrobiia bacterium]
MAPFAVCAVFLVSALVSTARLGLVEGGAGTLVGAGTLILGIVATAAILLVHAPWGRSLALAVTIVLLITAVIADWEWTSAASGLLSLAALGALSGPWLTPWLRQLSPPDGVGQRPMSLALGLVGFPVAAGVGAIDGVDAAHVIAGIIVPLIGWAYATGHSSGLWAARIAAPLLGTWVAAQSALPWSVVAGATTITLAFLAWTPEAARAIRPLYSTLPGPRHGRPIPSSDPT